MNKIKYEPHFCELLIQHMGSGMSYESFGAKVNVGRSTLYHWETVYPEWKEAKETAMEKALSFFETRLIAKISGQNLEGINLKNIDTSCLIFGLKTRFHTIYSEKTEVEHSGSVVINIDADDAAV